MKKSSSIVIVLGIGLVIAFQSHKSLQANSIPCQVINKTCPITVIFDVGGVLMEISSRSALWQVGPRNLFSYIVRNRSIPALQKRFFKILNRIDGSEGNPYGALDPDGKPLPNLMASWLLSKKQNEPLLADVTKKIKNHPEWFKSKQEQILITALAQFTFDPNAFANACRPIYEMVQFARQCKEKGYRLYVLSNWDSESFELLTQKYPEIFQLFDEIIISGNEHIMKPDPAIFSIITKQVPAQYCIFIDDQEENIEAARKMGMHAILAAPRRSLIGKLPDMAKIRTQFSCIIKEMCPNAQLSVHPDTVDTASEPMPAMQAE